MKLTSVAEQADLKLCLDTLPEDTDVTGAQVCDLLSHVMSHGRQGQLWVTIQSHPNIIAVAVLGRLAGIILADGMEPDEETIARAEEEGVALFTSPDSAYTVVGKLYESGVR